MNTRREFVQSLAAAAGTPLLAGGAASAQPKPAPPAGPDVGSLFPFIHAQAVKKGFPLSFLRGGGDRPGGPRDAGVRRRAVELVQGHPARDGVRNHGADVLRHARDGEVAARACSRLWKLR